MPNIGSIGTESSLCISAGRPGVRQRKRAAQRARVFDNMASISVIPNGNDQVDSGLPAREIEETTVRRKRQRKKTASSSNSCKTCERDLKDDRDGES